MIEIVGTNILVKPIVTERKTSSGIILSDDPHIKMLEGEVISWSPNVDLNVKAGDTVRYSRWGKQDIDINGEDYHLIDQSYILIIQRKE